MFPAIAARFGGQLAIAALLQVATKKKKESWLEVAEQSVVQAAIGTASGAATKSVFASKAVSPYVNKLPLSSVPVARTASSLGINHTIGALLGQHAAGAELFQKLYNFSLG